MRPVCCCTLLAVTLALTSVAAPVVRYPADVTVILDIRGAYSSAAIGEMQGEASRIIEASGIHLGWQLRSESMGASFADLVVVTFHGSCKFDPAPPVYNEPGPLAVTRTVNGQIQPFGEVSCDRVVNLVRSAMFGQDYEKADFLVGRALGRVLAHELVHMLTKSGKHAHDGVQAPSLTGRQLIAASLPLSAMDVDRLIQERRGH